MAQLGRTESLWHTAFGRLMKDGILELGYGQIEEKKVRGLQSVSGLSVPSALTCMKTQN